MNYKKELSGLKDKLNIDKVLKGITNIVEQKDPYSDMSPDDAVGHKIKALTEKTSAMHKVFNEQTKELKEVDHLLKDLFKDLEALRAGSKDTAAKKIKSEAKEE